MNIRIDEKNNSISIAAAELAFFSRKRRQLRRKPDFHLAGNTCEGECEVSVPLSFHVTDRPLDFTVCGDADRIYTVHGGTVMLEKIKLQSVISERTSPFSSPSFLAESMLCAYMLLSARGGDSLRLRLTYCTENAQRSISFEAEVERALTERVRDAIIGRAYPFIEIEAQRRLVGHPSLSQLAFPYTDIRDGQRDFINDAYYAAKTGGRLMVSAPTGIGKTVSALYPALRAVGDGYIDKIFYLTAKTVTGNAAAETCRKLAAQVPELRAVFISSKEKSCPLRRRDSSGRCSLRCTLRGEIERVSYEERRDEALLRLLSGAKVTDTAALENTAAEFRVCPHELSLELSEYCDVIICDYNYVFNTRMRLRRYFEGERCKKERYMLLIDEAHNLPDRARDMYSAKIDARHFMQLYKMQAERLAAQPELLRALKGVLAELKKTALLCREDERIVDGKTSGWYLGTEPPYELTRALAGYCEVQKKAAAADLDTAELTEGTAEEARAYCMAAAVADDKFRFYAEAADGGLTASVLCLDPSRITDSMMSAARCSVLFSATFSPMDYFADILGCRNAAQLELPSPYDPSRLCVIGVDSVSTRLSERDGCADEIAEMISAAVSAKQGNYIAYFPSYDYMEKVYKTFAENSDGVRCIVQRRGMSQAEHNRFLSEFSANAENKGETMLGFCVLGGAFAEGIDLRGDRLIGTIIVGTGLPKITAEQNILQSYFESTRENGFDYVYTYPSMIKVRQAAGRVIRSEKDCGVIVLVDDRYSDAAIISLMPESWHGIRYTGDPYSLSAAVEIFWQKFN